MVRSRSSIHPSVHLPVCPSVHSFDRPRAVCRSAVTLLELCVLLVFAYYGANCFNNLAWRYWTTVGTFAQLVRFNFSSSDNCGNSFRKSAWKKILTPIRRYFLATHSSSEDIDGFYFNLIWLIFLHFLQNISFSLNFSFYQ